MMTRQIYQDDDIEIRVATELEAVLHVAAIQASVNEIGAWETWCPESYSADDSRKYLADSELKRHRGAEFNFCLFERANGNLIGSVSLNRIVHEYKFANLGYYTGRALATLAVRAAARFAFTELELTRLEIVAMEGNARSGRVAEKAGATSEGLHRNRLYYHGQPRDVWVYSLIPGDL